MANPFDLAEAELRGGNPFDLAEAELRQPTPTRPQAKPLPTGVLGLAAKGIYEDLQQGLGRTVQGGVGALASVPEALGVVAHRLGGGVDAAGQPLAPEDTELYRAGQAMRRAAGMAFPVDENRPKKFVTDTLPQAAGSTLGFVATGVAGRAARLPLWLTPAATGAAAGGIDGYADAKAHGASEDVAWMSFLVNAGVGTSEAVLIAKWLDRVNRTSNGAIRRALVEGGEEGLQELIQQVSKNALASQTYDPERPWAKDAAEGAAAGFTVGSLFSLLFRGRDRTNPAAPPPPPPPAPPAPPAASPPAPTAAPAAQGGIPADAEVVGPPGIQINLESAETPGIEGPVAVFRGSNGQDIRIAIAPGGLSAAQAYAFRAWPGAEFVGVEGIAPPGPPPPAPSPPQPAPPAPPPPAPTAAAAPASIPPAPSADERAALQAELDAELEQTTEEATPPPPEQAPERPGVANEETQAEQPRQPPGAPVEPEPTAAPVKVKVSRAGSLIKRFNRETELYGEDLLSWIVDSGRMMSAKQARAKRGGAFWKANKSLYDDKAAIAPHHKSILYGGERAPDQVAQAAYDAGKISAPDVNVLWAEIEKASQGRLGNIKAAKTEAAWLKAEVEEIEAWQKATEEGAIKVSAQELKVGDVLEVEGERVEVTKIDPDTLDVTLKDGRKFGTKTLPDGASIYVETYNPATADDPWADAEAELAAEAAPQAAPKPAAPAAEAAPEPAPPPAAPFALDAPESPDEMKAREAAEAAQAQANADRARLAQLAARPLTGTTGDLGQGDLLAGPQDLWAVPTPGLVSGTAAEKWADDVIKDKLGGTSANVLLDPKFMAAVTIKAAAILERGVRDVAAMAKALIRRMPELRSLSEARWRRLFEDAMDLAEMHATGQVLTPNEIAAAGMVMEPFAKWTQQQWAVIDDYFGDDAPLFRELLAATSANSTIASNVTLALKAFDQLVEGRPFTGYLSAVASNLNRIRAGSAPVGQKISQWNAAMQGDPDAVAIDRHVTSMLYGAGLTKPTRAQVRHGIAVVRNVARQMGWTSQQLQAGLWAANIKRTGQPIDSYATRLQAIDAQTGLKARIRQAQARARAEAARDYEVARRGAAQRTYPARSDRAGVQERLNEADRVYGNAAETRTPAWQERARRPYQPGQLSLGLDVPAAPSPAPAPAAGALPARGGETGPGGAAGRRGTSLPNVRAQLTPHERAQIEALQTGTPEAYAKAFALGDQVNSIDPERAPSGAQPFNIIGKRIATPLDFVHAVIHLRSPYQESLKVAILDKNNQVVHSEVLYTGTIDSATVSPRDFLRLWKNHGNRGTRIVLSHNHPGGDPNPSLADIQVTAQLRRMAKSAGFTITDHIITNGTRYARVADWTHYQWETAYIDNQALADWEWGARLSLPEVSNQVQWEDIALQLRQGDPHHAHLIFLNTRLRVVAVHRMQPQGNFLSALAAGAAQGAQRVMIDFGPNVVDGEARNYLQVYVSQAQQAGIELTEAAWRHTPSAKAAGYIHEARADLLAQPSPEIAAAEAVLREDAAPATGLAADQLSQEADARLRAAAAPAPKGMRIQPGTRAGEAGFVLNPIELAKDVFLAGAAVLRRLGTWTATKAQWVAAMAKAYGDQVKAHLDATWTRLARLANQIANNIGPEAQGHVNAVETLAGRTNTPDEEKPLYSDATLAAGAPSLLTRASPQSVQIRRLGGAALLRAKQRRDIEEATAAAAVKQQSQNLWDQLVDAARKANPLKDWHLPDWIIATPRARQFKGKALHIAARLNATGRDQGGQFVFEDFTMRAGAMSTREFAAGKHQVGDEIELVDNLTGQVDRLKIGALVTPPDGRVFYQLYRFVPADVQAEIYRHYAQAYPELMWFVDMFIDPALAATRQTINGIQVPVFNRFAAAVMMADGHSEFEPLAAYTPDVLVTRSLLSTIRSALSFSAGTRSPGRRYKSGQSRESGHVRDLLSAFNIRTWQMLAETSRKRWMQAVLQAATPIQKNVIPAGWERVETGMENLWQAVKRLRHWRSPEDWRPLKQREIDDLDEFEATLKPTERIVKKDGRYFLATKLYPETEARMTQLGPLWDEEREYAKFFGEAIRLRGRQLMIPTALREQVERAYRAQVTHGWLYRLGAWALRNSHQLMIATPLTYVSNVLTNDLFTVEAAFRAAVAGAVGRDVTQLRFARELMVGEFTKWFPGLRAMIDPSFQSAVEEVLPDVVFADQTALADVKVRVDESPGAYLRSGELGAAALNLIRYGNIDIRSKQRMAYAWLKAMAVTRAKTAGLSGDALRVAVEDYLRNPPVEDRARAVDIAGFELLNYADTPAPLDAFARNDYSKLVWPFPRFGYHFITKNVRRAAAVRDLLSKVPPKRRAAAFADLVTFLMFPAGGAGIVGALLAGWGDDDDEARKLVGTSRITTISSDGSLVSKPIDRSLVTVNRINLTGWARQLGLGDPEREEDFWLRVRNYPVIAMAGAALLGWSDAKKFGPPTGIRTYLGAVTDLSSDFLSIGMAAKVPDKALQTLRDQTQGRNPPSMVLDPYATRVPMLAYITDQTLDAFVPGTRQADLLIRWLDPTHRRRSASRELRFNPSVWDAARVGHWTGLLDRLLAGRPGTTSSTLPPEGQVARGRVIPQTYPLTQRLWELGGFNVRPIDRSRYERALSGRN